MTKISKINEWIMNEWILTDSTSITAEDRVEQLELSLSIKSEYVHHYLVDNFLIYISIYIYDKIYIHI